MIERVVHPYNLQKALEQVVRNKGSAGVDGIKTTQLKTLFPDMKPQLLEAIRQGNYLPQAILGVEISKGKRKNPTFGSSYHHRPSVATSRRAGYCSTI